MSGEVDRILKSIRKDWLPDSDELPPMEKLRQSLGSTRYALRQALLVLRAENLIQFTRGSSIRVLSQRPRALPAAGPKSSSQRLFEGILAEIQSGALPQGALIPKKQFYSQVEHMSPRTVARTFDRLQQEGWIHPEGVRYRVGRSRSQRSGNRPGNPVILLVMDKRNIWEGLYLGHLRPFAETFCNEAQAHGVRLLPVTKYAFRGESTRFLLELSKAAEFAKTLGKLYFGALVVTGYSGAEGSGGLIQAAEKLRKPVVWFDRSGSGGIAPLPGRYRAAVDERGGLYVGLKTLWDAGHREVLFPLLNTDSMPAQIDFCEWAMSIARQEFPGMRIHPTDLSPGLSARIKTLPGMLEYFGRMSNSPLADGMHAFLREYQRRTGGEFQNLLLIDTLPSRDQLPEDLRANLIQWHGIRRYIALCAEHIESTGATAVLSSSGDEAVKLVNALEYLGMRVPEVISVLGLNAPGSGNLPSVSFVDFGYAQLGHSAFHKLLGDIRIESDSEGNLYSRPSVRDMGSIGSP